MSKPLLLIDVDGVLNPVGDHSERKGWQKHTLAGWPVRLHPKHGKWLSALADVFDLTWATTWEDEANQYIAPIVGLPQMPVVPFTEEAFIEDHRGTTWKLSGVAHYVGDRPCAWLDDDIWQDALDWAEGRTLFGIPTLVVWVKPEMGLLEHHIEKLKAFAQSLEAA